MSGRNDTLRTHRHEPRASENIFRVCDFHFFFLGVKISECGAVVSSLRYLLRCCTHTIDVDVATEAVHVQHQTVIHEILDGF
jgi:hypothetical protein